MVERLHWQLKDALRARGAADPWEDHLPWVLLGLLAVPKDESGVSAAEAVLGQQLKVPGQAATPHVGGLPTAQLPPGVIPATRSSYAEVVSSSSTHMDGPEWVYVQKGRAAKPLADNYEGPFCMLKRGTKFFKLQLGKRADNVSRDRLKPHLAREDLEPAVVRPRGRPRGGRLSDTSSLLSTELMCQGASCYLPDCDAQTC